MEIFFNEFSHIQVLPATLREFKYRGKGYKKWVPFWKRKSVPKVDLWTVEWPFNESWTLEEILQSYGDLLNIKKTGNPENPVEFRPRWDVQAVLLDGKCVTLRSFDTEAQAKNWVRQKFNCKYLISIWK